MPSSSLASPVKRNVISSGVNHFTTTACDIQTTSQTVRLEQDQYRTLASIRFQVSTRLRCIRRTLMCEHNAHVHRTAIVVPFTMVLSHQPRGLTTFITTTAMLTDIKCKTLRNALRHRLSSRLFEIPHHAEERLKPAQQRYKQHQDVQVREQMHFQAGKLAFLDCPARSTSAADEMAVESWLKLLPYDLCLYRTTSTTSQTRETDQGRSPNKISLVHLSVAPNSVQC